jgi:hypothetical protein
VRAVAPTVSSDVPGLKGAVAVPSYVTDAATRQARGAAATIAALQTETLAGGGRPWVPEMEPATHPAGAQAAEKTEFASRTLSVDGDYADLTTIGEALNVSWLVSRGAQDSVLAIAARDVLQGVAQFLVAQLVTAGGTAVADIPAALAAIETAGYTPDLILASASAWATVAGDPRNAASYVGLPVIVGAPTGADLIVVALSGLWCGVSGEQQWTVSEPSIGGVELAVFMDVGIVAAPGAVAIV